MYVRIPVVHLYVLYALQPAGVMCDGWYSVVLCVVLPCVVAGR